MGGGGGGVEESIFIIKVCKSLMEGGGSEQINKILKSEEGWGDAHKEKQFEIITAVLILYKLLVALPQRSKILLAKSKNVYAWLIAVLLSCRQ